MFRAGICVAAGAVVTVAAWAGGAHFTPLEAAPPADAKDAKDAKPVDLTPLRDAVGAAAKKGENVDEIAAALDALDKSAPKPAAGRVPPELQALRDAVDAAAKKGENVEAIARELAAVEMTVAGKTLVKPKPPEPRPDPNPRPGFPAFPNPVPFPIAPNPGVGGGIDVEMFNKAMELRRKAVELMLKNPRDPEVIKEAQKLQAEAAEMLLKAARNAGGGLGGVPALPVFPDIDRGQDRARLGIRLDKIPAVAVEQLGLEPNTGIAITMVAAESSAEKAGLKVHDIILDFAGKAVTDNTEDFIRRVNEVKVGDKVDLVVLRKGKKVDVKGVELPAARQFRMPAVPAPLVPFPMLPLPGLPDAPAPPVLAPAPVNPPALPPPSPLPQPVPPVVPAALPKVPPVPAPLPLLP